MLKETWTAVRSHQPDIDLDSMILDYTNGMRRDQRTRHGVSLPSPSSSLRLWVGVMSQHMPHVHSYLAATNRIADLLSQLSS